MVLVEHYDFQVDKEFQGNHNIVEENDLWGQDDFE